MRIIIDIDGNNINVTTEPRQKIAVVSPALPSGVPLTPPPELLKAAAAIGAQDAGPVPAHIVGLVKGAVLQEAAGPTQAGAAPSRPGKAAKITGKTQTKTKKR